MAVADETVVAAHPRRRVHVGRAGGVACAELGGVTHGVAGPAYDARRKNLAIAVEGRPSRDRACLTVCRVGVTACGIAAVSVHAKARRALGGGHARGWGVVALDGVQRDAVAPVGCTEVSVVRDERAPRVARRERGPLVVVAGQQVRPARKHRPVVVDHLDVDFVLGEEGEDEPLAVVPQPRGPEIPLGDLDALKGVERGPVERDPPCANGSGASEHRRRRPDSQQRGWTDREAPVPARPSVRELRGSSSRELAVSFDVSHEVAGSARVEHPEAVCPCHQFGPRPRKESGSTEVGRGAVVAQSSPFQLAVVTVTPDELQQPGTTPDRPAGVGGVAEVRLGDDEARTNRGARRIDTLRMQLGERR